MTSERNQKGRETWESWLPEGTVIPETDLITREDLISSLAYRGVKVTPRDLANWQSDGVIPYGLWKWHEPTRKTRALYPAMMISLIAQLRRYQREGMRLRTIEPRLRRLARQADGLEISEQVEHEAWARKQRDMILDTIGRHGEAITVDEAIDLARATGYEVLISIRRRAEGGVRDE